MGVIPKRSSNHRLRSAHRSGVLGQVGSSEPDRAALGHQWFDSALNRLRVFNGSVWQDVSNVEVLGTGVEADTTAYKLQTGTTLGVTDVNGVLVITFPTAFPETLVTVVAMMGCDSDTLLVMSDDYVTDNINTKFTVRAYANGGGVLASAAIRVNWIATGY